jgi:hypothetical protein
VYLHLFLTAELDGDEWSASRPGRFTSGRKLEGVDPARAFSRREKFLTPTGVGTPDRPACSLVTILLTLF